MLTPSFLTAAKLAERIDAYFDYTEGEFHDEAETPEGVHIAAKRQKGEARAKQKICDREPGPPTIAGLAFFLGFNSRQAFDDYERKGKFAHLLKRCCLRIEALYEKKLLQQSPTGAIFALKSMGRNNKTGKKADRAGNGQTLLVKLVETGPKPVNCEKEVIL
ncbi:MAG TPA: terminase small subunit [Mucilaginibacter sp.]